MKYKVLTALLSLALVIVTFVCISQAATIEVQKLEIRIMFQEILGCRGGH